MYKIIFAHFVREFFGFKAQQCNSGIFFSHFCEPLFLSLFDFFFYTGLFVFPIWTLVCQWRISDLLSTFRHPTKYTLRHVQLTSCLSLAHLRGRSPYFFNTTSFSPGPKSRRFPPSQHRKHFYWRNQNTLTQRKADHNYVQSTNNRSVI